MKKTPQIYISFCLTKNDQNDFNRNDISKIFEGGKIQTSEPRISRGRLIHPIEDLSTIRGLSIIGNPKDGKLLKHSFWNVDMPIFHVNNIEKPLQEMICLFKGKEDFLRQMCDRENLSADLILHILAEPNNLPEITVPSEILSFCSSLSANINIDIKTD